MQKTLYYFKFTNGSYLCINECDFCEATLAFEIFLSTACPVIRFVSSRAGIGRKRLWSFLAEKLKFNYHKVASTNVFVKMSKIPFVSNLKRLACAFQNGIFQVNECTIIPKSLFLEINAWNFGYLDFTCDMLQYAAFDFQMSS